jgi:hypothetical protein
MPLWRGKPGVGVEHLFVIASVSEAIQLAASKEAGLLRRIRLRPKAGFGGQERSSQ